VHTDHIQNQHWERQISVANTVDLEKTYAQGTSQREFARQRDIPRTTLQYWLSRKQGLDASPALVDFFESSEGLAFQHRLVIALQFVMCFLCGCGVRPVAKVLELAGLGVFVANSFGSRQKLGAAMEEELRNYALKERERLASQMAAKRITLCEDETFHPEICLVAIEPVSNFILLEAYAEGRDAATWTAALKAALRELPVEVVQSTSDEGKGLLAHVRQGLGAHHSPDIFHVQQELSRATSIALAGRVKQAEKTLTKAVANTEAKCAAQQTWAENKHGPGRPPNFDGRIAEARETQQQAEQELEAARQRQERARQAIREIGRSYHPVDLDTGALRTAEQVTTDLERCFTDITEVATEASLPERCDKGIRKAYRVVPEMTCTMGFFHSEVAAQIESLDLTLEQARAVYQGLIPAAYLENAARKAKQADDRGPLRELAAELRSDSEAGLADLDQGSLMTVNRVAQECADFFQRSSSCVEGRNGHLSLLHHSLHRLRASRLEALTAVHNFFIQRPDGTTAADRFFGAKPAELFDWLLDHLDMPARPARKRPSQSASTVLN
jgi:hypothetical protein